MQFAGLEEGANVRGYITADVKDVTTEGLLSDTVKERGSSQFPGLPRSRNAAAKANSEWKAARERKRR